MTPPWDHWDIHPSVAIGLACFGGLYLFWGGTRASVSRQISFWASVLVMFFSLDGPLHDLSSGGRVIKTGTAIAGLDAGPKVIQ